MKKYLNRLYINLPLMGGAIILGCLNWIFHTWSDWCLSLHISVLQGVDLYYGPSKYPNVIVLSSWYGGSHYGFLKLFQILLIVSLSGFFSIRIITEILRRKKVTHLTFIKLIIFWVLKIPVPVKYINLDAIYSGLLAW